MAWRCGSLSRSLHSAARTIPSRSSISSLHRPSSPSLRSLLLHSRRPLVTVPRTMGLLGCTQSLMPLHSAEAAARLTSHISVESRACCELSQARRRKQMRYRISVIKQDVDGGSQTVGNFEIVTREEDNLREWLSLGLKVDMPLAAEQNPDSHLKPLHNKVISHAISARESLTVHKPWVVTRMHTKGKEEQPQGTKSGRMMMTPMGIAYSSLAARSLGIQPHSLVHKPSRQRCAMLARFSEANSGIGMAWTPSMHEQAVDSVWPGSFRVNLPRQGSDVNKLLDLNRRL